MGTEEQPRKSTHTKTFILWDMVDFRVDEDKIHTFYRRLRKSLRDEHYCGELCITAYGHGEDSCLLGTESVHTYIRLYRLKDRFARHNTMVVDMISLLRLNPQANFMLIMKPMAEENIEYNYVIQEVKKKNYSVLLVVDDDKDQDNSRFPPDVLSGCTVWTWTSLLRGEPPTRREDDDEEEDDDDSYTSDEGSSSKRQKKFDDASILSAP